MGNLNIFEFALAFVGVFLVSCGIASAIMWATELMNEMWKPGEKNDQFDDIY